MFKEFDKSDIKKIYLLLTIFTCIIVILMEVGYFRHSHVVFIISIPAIITLASVFALVLRRIDLKQRRNMELIRKASERLETANSKNAYISRALRKHLTQYRTLLANLPVGIFRSTPDGQYLSANPAMVKIFGYDTEDELKSVHIPDLYLDPNDRKKIFDELHRNRSGQGVEVRMKRRDGSIIWVSSSIRVIFDENDQPLYYDGILKDITERKRADAALHEMHDLNRVVVENSPVGISVRDRHGRLLSYNNAWQRIWAIPDDVIRDYMSRPRSSLNFDARDSYLGEWQDDVKRIYEEGGYLYIPEVVSESHRPGSSRFVSQHFWAVKDNDGQVDRVIILTEDMTTRKTAEEMFSTIFMISPIPTLVTELYSGVVIDANKAFTDLVQLSREQVIGSDTLDLGIWNAESDREKMVERIRASKCASNFPVTILNSEGNQRECLVSAKLIELGENPQLVCMLVDITDQRKMESEMVRREKLDSIGLLAGGIAHDFNNILTTVLGNISMALSSTESRDEMFQWLADAEKASLQARDLTQQLLTFSKGGAPILKATSVVDIIRESAKFALHGSNVGCCFNLSDDLPAVKADVAQINQVLSNIIINADQAMPDGGEIVISASGVNSGDSSQLPLEVGDYIKIEIKDQGIGISKQHLSKIFDPFFTTKQKGNGLGLATAYSIIKKHDGHLMAQSELGKGSEFTIYLPATGSPISPVAATPMQYRCIQKCRILIMDDDELIRTMTVKALEKCGCSADFTDNGSDAVEFYKKARESGNPYDLVIMDLTIPGGMGGRETILVLRKIDPDIKAIVSSGYSSDPVMSNPQKYGFNAGIAKPFKVDALYKTVYEAMNEETASETVCC